MGELPRAAVVADLAREDAAHAGPQLGLAERLVEEGEGEDAVAVADRHLEDRPLAVLHPPLGHRAHLGHDRDRLVERQLAEGGQLAAAGVAARVVGEQVADRAQAERLLEHLRRATAERGRELGIQRRIHAPSVPRPATRTFGRMTRRAAQQPAPDAARHPPERNMRATATMSASANPDAAVRE